MKPLLQGKTALITGASRGMGAQIARAFAAHGANLLLLSRNETALKELATELDTYPVRISVFGCDITDEAQLKDLFQQFSKQTNLDILVNNAGVMQAKPLTFIRKSDWQQHYAVNTFAVYQLCQLAARLMIRNQGGVIVNMVSMLGEYGQAGQSLYAGSKAAVSALTRSLAQELAQHRIRVNAIAPGLIDTDLTKDISAADKQKILSRVALGRMGTASEIAKICLFLASDWSSYVNGEIIHADGGIHF